eukprot:6279990-Alexandrium_andersonii.AAC.1
MNQWFWKESAACLLGTLSAERPEARGAAPAAPVERGREADENADKREKSSSRSPSRATDK